MQKKHIFYLLLAGLIFKSFQGFGQESMILYYLEGVPQSNLRNPALAPRCNAFLGVPGVNAVYTNIQTNISPKIFLQDSDSGTVTLTSKYFDYGKLYKKIGKKLMIRNYNLETPLTLGFRINNDYYTFTFSEKVKINAMLPADIFKILDKGGVQDRSVLDFSRFGINAQMYQEYAFGYSRDIIKNLRVGARFKILQGIYSVKTNMQKFTLNASDVLWSFDVKGDIYSSLPLEARAKEDGTVDTVLWDDMFSYLSSIKKVKGDLFNFSNLGMAFDLGAVYDLNDYWSFSASIIDLGFIRWKKGLNSFHFNNAYEFKGLEINNSNIDTLDKATDALIDSINYFEGSLGHDKFSTGPGTAIYLGGEFRLNHYFSAGLVSRSFIDRNYFYQEFNLSANLNLYNMLTTNLNYNVSFTGEQYAGWGFALYLFPVQVYLMLDNIPLTYTHYMIDDEDRIPAPYEIRSFNFMVGLNFLFGARGYHDHAKIDAYSEF